MWETGVLKRWRFVATVLAVAGCASGRQATGAESLVGNWQWVGSFGGIAGRPVPATRAGVRFRFLPGGTFEIVQDEAVLDRTRYTLSAAGPDARAVVRYDAPVSVLLPPQREQFVRFVGADTLVLADPCADCFEHTFVRVR